MKKKFLLVLLFSILFLSVSVCSFAMDNLANGARNVVDSTKNTLSEMGNDISNGVKNGMNTIKNGTEKIETGMKKVGAMLGDNVEIGCGSVLNPGTIIGRNTNVYPLSSVRGVVKANSIYKNRNEIVEKQSDKNK